MNELDRNHSGCNMTCETKWIQRIQICNAKWQTCKKYYLFLCEIFRWQGDDYKDCCFLAYDVVQSRRNFPTFREYSPSSS